VATARSTAAAGARAETPPSASRSTAEQILAKAQGSREVIQEFVPLAESLEWELGQEYLRQRGNKAFISDASPVPFVINNDGNLSRNAAEVFFTSLKEAEKEGSLSSEEEIFVLELGIGVGLFARFFLDHFRELCWKNDKDYYDRLCYILGDKSERMLTDACRHGVLANHPGRYRVRIVDAMCPEKELPYDVCFLNHPNRQKPFRAVFLNYLLDCLPAASLEVDENEVRQLCVRTCVARNIKLEDHTDLTVEQLRDRAKSKSPRDRQEILEVYGLFASEYDYRPVDVKQLPFGDFALEVARKYGKRVLHNYGAIQCLERLLELTHDRGFILINDYGQTMMTREDEFEHQRFSLATFVGVNFQLLETYFGESKKACWERPMGEAQGIHSRLLGRQPDHGTRVRFTECFSADAQDKLHEPIQKARECAKVGRFEMAAMFYNQALERQPRNWVLLNEVSMFLTFSLRDLKAGIDMAKVALSLNPSCSSELWNTLGDGLFEFGRDEEARSAYQRAMEVNESDVRARYNLAWVHTRQGNFSSALAVIGEGLALDKTGEYRDRFLHKQQEALAKLGMRNQQEYLLLINLVSKYAKREEQEKPKAERAETNGPSEPTGRT
jgi:tetratricopeptide (TPR) repeat protein